MFSHSSAALAVATRRLIGESGVETLIDIPLSYGDEEALEIPLDGLPPSYFHADEQRGNIWRATVQFIRFTRTP